MDKHEFMSKVKARAALGDEDAIQTVRAVLETLGRRLFGGESSDLAAQLPKEIKGFLQPAEANEAFGAERFIEIVADQTQTSAGTAEKHIRAVFSVLSEAVTSGELADVRSQLPDEYNRFFQ